MGRQILRVSDVILAQLLGPGPGWRIKANPLPADARVIRTWVGSCHGCPTVFLYMESASWPEVPSGDFIPFVDPEPILETIEPPGFEVGPGEVHVTTATILRDIYLERCSRDNIVFRSIENGCLTFWRPESASSEGPEVPSPPPREETWRDRSIRDPMI